MKPALLPMMAYASSQGVYSAGLTYWTCRTTTIRLGEVTQITASCGQQTAYWHWYIDGSHVAATTSPSYTIQLSVGDQVRIVVFGTNDPDFDPVKNAPEGWSARRTLWWVRSLDADCSKYRIDQKKDAEDYAALAEVHCVDGQWTYEHLTDRLDDLSDYTWRIVPVDAAGNDGTAKTVGPERIVRVPDSPDFEISFEPATAKVTFN